MFSIPSEWSLWPIMFLGITDRCTQYESYAHKCETVYWPQKVGR